MPLLKRVATHGAVAASLLVWYKLSGTMFPPVVALAGLILPLTANAGDASTFVLSEASFLAVPWLAGHAWLFIAAWATSWIRGRARIAFASQRFADWHDRSDAQLKAIFDRFDVDDDGSLTGSELKVALKVAVGVEFPDSDVAEFVKLADTDGTGTISFDEFKAISRQELS
jgi:hypothetical protein